MHQGVLSLSSQRSAVDQRKMLPALWRALEGSGAANLRVSRMLTLMACQQPRCSQASEACQPSTSGRADACRAAPCGWRQYSNAASALHPAANSDAGVGSLTSSAAGTGSRSELDDGYLSTLLLNTPSKELGPSHIGLYYPFQRALVPEAFRDFHQAFYAPRPGPLQRRGGCTGLQSEFASSGSNHLMYRRCMHEVLGALLDGQQQGLARRVLLDGPSGSGKSVALAAVVERLRSDGWLVLYVPSAAALTSGGLFYRRKDGNGLYDTVISAQHILKSMVDAHRDALAVLPRQLDGRPAGMPSGASLLDLCTAGLATDEDAQLAVEACLALVQELGRMAAAGQAPVLLAVDDYNALHWRSDYGVTTYVNREDKKRSYQHRRELGIDELALASGLRVLAPGTQNGGAHVLCATTASHGISPKLWPDGASQSHVDADHYNMPRFSAVETAHALFYYYERGLASDVPSSGQLHKVQALTNGNAAEVRRLSVKASAVEHNIM